jgi:cyclase
MSSRLERPRLTRRELMRSGAALAGGAVVVHALPWLRTTVHATAWSRHAQQPAGSAAAADARRAEIAKAPIVSTPLGPNLTLLSGPGGNVVVLNGPDGKVVVDSFVQPAWKALKTTMDGLGSTPVKVLIDTHWHFDHADNNANFRGEGAEIVAHENTRKRLAEPHDVLGMHFDPAPAAALPTKVFATSHKIDANSEAVELGYIPPAHTDTDLYIRFLKGNVLHLGDVFFNGVYPFIDASTGGSIGGMIAGADKALGLADGQTQIVPGHGPLADKAALTTYRDMLVTVRDRVQKLKTSGRALADVVAQKPTADLDPVWGKGFMQPDFFVTIVYNTV